MTKQQVQQTKYDVVIVGGGMVGLVLAAALLQQDFSIAIIENNVPTLQWPDDNYVARVSAINWRSIQVLKKLGIWADISARSYGILQKLNVWDSVGGAAIDFDCADVDKSEFGVILENRELVRAAWQMLQKQNQLHFYCPEKITRLDFADDSVSLQLQSQQQLIAQCIIGADGGHSWVREQMCGPMRQYSYRQRAIVAVVQSEKPHQQTAYQAFLPTGPLALLPLSHPHRCAFVWSLSNKKAYELQQLDQLHFECELCSAFGVKLGHMQCLTQRSSFPLTMRHVDHYVDSRVALVGDAAHTIHPLAGQGVNLGIMDAACLVECMGNARQAGQDFASRRVLRRYERWRKGDNTRMIYAMRMLNDVFASQSGALMHARNLGLQYTNKFILLKKLLMHVAMGDMDELPQLAQ